MWAYMLCCIADLNELYDLAWFDECYKYTVALIASFAVCISCCLWCLACCWALRHCCGESKSMGCTVTKLQPVTNIPWSELCALLGAGCH